MDIIAIQNLINRAKALESENRHLHKHIYNQMESLHHTIELPEERASDTVFQFIVEYIDHVPVFIDGLYHASAEAGIRNFIYPFLDIAEENFLSFTSREDELTGLDVLLDKAYFAHRLIEEVNDKYLLKTGSALIPLNMTWSNLIVHSILGEPFANELDSLIEQTVRQMMRSQSIYNKALFHDFVDTRSSEQWINLWTQWAACPKSWILNLSLQIREPDSDNAVRLIEVLRHP